jgi:hypothetical protein
MKMQPFMPRNARTVLPVGYEGYQGVAAGVQQPAPVQSVADILTQSMPDLAGQKATAGRKREIADMLTQGAMSRQATDWGTGLAKLGEAWIARNADKSADKAETERDRIVQELTQKAVAGDEASIAALLSPEAAIGRRDQERRYGEEKERYVDERDYLRARDTKADENLERQWNRDEQRWETEQEYRNRVQNFTEQNADRNFGLQQDQFGLQQKQFGWEVGTDERDFGENQRQFDMTYGLNRDKLTAETAGSGAGVAPALANLPPGVQSAIVGNDLKNIDAVTADTARSSQLVSLAEEWLRQAEGYKAQGGGFMADIGQALSQKTNPLKGLTEQMVMLQKKPGTGEMTDDDAKRAQKATLNVNQGEDANKQVLRIYQAQDKNYQDHQSWLREAQALYGYGSGGMAQQQWLEYSRANPVYDKETGEPIMDRKPISQWLKEKPGGGASAAPSPSGGPPVGTVKNGYRFKGGNPNDRNSWEPVR